ncbi:MAG: UDP-N-acetylglucosamine 1-carboxyvinyltransferase, partial [Eubacteriales bacterium]|nr:UDP-N-acetylglucosamine 1-carboxyvinyltransferase [Eubacteriales bacterium]
MSAYLIQGGSPLFGEVTVQGAKNSVLPILAATILTGAVSVLHNCPQLTDVDASVAILRHLGCVVVQDGETITVDSSTMHRWDVPDQLMREMRSSVVFLGAILGRMGQAELSMPGGCELGPRPIDLHLAALTAMGGQVKCQGGSLHCRGHHLRGREIVLSIPSVGATENAM